MTRNVLFLAGANKSGTTSLAAQLGEHPRILAAVVKQPRCFLDSRSVDETHACLQQAFPQGAASDYLLEATPDYLHERGSAGRIAAVLGVNAPRFIFILRDPLERLNSWFSYGKQIGLVAADESLETFIDKARRDQGDTEPYRSVATGCYAPFLREFLEHFPRSSLCIVDFADYRERPREVLGRIAGFLDLPGDPFDDVELQVRNRTVATRSDAIRRVYAAARRLTMGAAMRSRAAASVVRTIEPFARKTYRMFNTSAPASVANVDASVRTELERMYADDARELKSLFDFEASWA